MATVSTANFNGYNTGAHSVGYCDCDKRCPKCGRLKKPNKRITKKDIYDLLESETFCGRTK